MKQYMLCEAQIQRGPKRGSLTDRAVSLQDVQSPFQADTRTDQDLNFLTSRGLPQYPM